MKYRLISVLYDGINGDYLIEKVGLLLMFVLGDYLYCCGDSYNDILPSILPSLVLLTNIFTNCL